jgi:hypothetical protein
MFLKLANFLCGGRYVMLSNYHITDRSLMFDRSDQGCQSRGPQNDHIASGNGKDKKKKDKEYEIYKCRLTDELTSETANLPDMSETLKEIGTQAAVYFLGLC